jgi:hypothetical protein
LESSGSSTRAMFRSWKLDVGYRLRPSRIGVGAVQDEIVDVHHPYECCNVFSAGTYSNYWLFI